MQMPPTPPDTPTRQDWNDLLAALTALYRLESTNSDRLDGLEASVGAQEALLRALTRQVGQLPTQSQLEALKQAIRLFMTQYRTEGARPDVKAES